MLRLSIVFLLRRRRRRKRNQDMYRNLPMLIAIFHLEEANYAFRLLQAGLDQLDTISICVGIF
jgi:hypothetical protein